MSNATGQRMGLDSLTPVWRRRQWLALATFAIVLTAVVGVAAFLPDVYRATATILVERPDAPESLSRAGESGEMETRLQIIEAKLLSRARLEGLVRRFALDRSMRTKGGTTEAAIEEMRRHILLEPKRNDTTSGGGATVSLALSYWGDDPRTVAAVANTIAASYVDDNLKSRERQAASSAGFLKTQLDEAKTQMDESGAEQARLTGRRDGLVKRLAATEPAVGPASAGAVHLAKLRQDLIELRTRYRDNHPEVIRLRKEIQTIETQIAGAPPPQPRAAPAADNDAIQRLRADLAEANAGLMSNDYTAVKDRYVSLLKLYEEARFNESMEEGQQGVRFAILDAAIVPDTPAAPNRLRILLGGLAIAIGMAFGTVVLAEHLDTSFHEVGDLQEFTQVQVLAAIPRIATRKGKWQRRYRFFLGASLTALGLLLATGLSWLVAHWDASLALMIIGGHA